MVWSENAETGESELKEVTELFQFKKNITVTVALEDEDIITTELHLFYTKEKGWICADELEVGDTLITLDCKEKLILDVTKEVSKDIIIVYNFEVKDNHNYYVGDNEVLVHNANKCVDVFPYKERNKHKTKVNQQAHHINQNAAFKPRTNSKGGPIPENDGLCVMLEGNIFQDIGSPHYKAHKTMEAFWDDYRRGGKFYPTLPLIKDYNKALYDSMINAGFSKKQAKYIVDDAKKQQLSFNLNENQSVPHRPRRITLK